MWATRLNVLRRKLGIYSCQKSAADTDVRRPMSISDSDSPHLLWCSVNADFLHYGPTASDRKYVSGLRESHFHRLARIFVCTQCRLSTDVHRRNFRGDGVRTPTFGVGGRTPHFISTPSQEILLGPSHFSDQSYATGDVTLSVHGSEGLKIAMESRFSGHSPGIGRVFWGWIASEADEFPQQTCSSL